MQINLVVLSGKSRSRVSFIHENVFFLRHFPPSFHPVVIPLYFFFFLSALSASRFFLSFSQKSYSNFLRILHLYLKSCLSVSNSACLFVCLHVCLVGLVYMSVCSSVSSFVRCIAFTPQGLYIYTIISFVISRSFVSVLLSVSNP